MGEEVIRPWRLSSCLAHPAMKQHLQSVVCSDFGDSHSTDLQAAQESFFLLSCTMLRSSFLVHEQHSTCSQEQVNQGCHPAW